MNSKEVIITKWIYNTPLISLKEAASNAMDEYRSIGEQEMAIKFTTWFEDLGLFRSMTEENGVRYYYHKLTGKCTNEQLYKIYRGLPLNQEGVEKTYGEKLIDAIEKLEYLGLWEEWKEENPEKVNVLKKLINNQ